MSPLPQHLLSVRRPWLTACVSFVVIAACGSAIATQTLNMSRAELLNRIKGGWAGQMIGVSYGAPTEFRSNAKINEGEITWAPDRVSNALEQDDLYVEMTFARVIDAVGLSASCQQYGEAFKNSKYHLWHANAGARRALGQGIQAPWSGHPKYNFHANDIDFQIEADFIGLMCPGLFRKSNEFCDRVGRVMNYGDGLYGGMFVCGMYAAGFYETDPRKVVEAGLACIPPKSEYAMVIRDLLAWSVESPNDWRQVWQRIEQKWDKNDPCPDGALEPFNIDAKLNGAYIAVGLLFGNLDFMKTLEISTRCGQDSDCNPSSAAGVLGVMLGWDRIPEQCKGGIAALADKKFSFTEYSFNDIVLSTEKRALQLIRATGGEVSETEVHVRMQRPKAPKLEQWSPGIPDKRLRASEACWGYTGNWSADKESKVSTTAGNEVSVRFTGVAVAILGALEQDGGRAEVYLDGRKVGSADAYIVERTHDNVLWNVYGLKQGEHVVRLVTSNEADPRSKGHRVAIYEAVTYRAK
jgi:hypothetical protein